MNRAAVTHRAELLLFLWVFANDPIRRQNFIPVFIGLFHRIYLALMFRAVQMAGFAQNRSGVVREARNNHEQVIGPST